MALVQALTFPKKTIITSVALWIIVIMIYYDIFNTLRPITTSTTSWMTIELSTIKSRKEIPHHTEQEIFLLNNTGCYIPNISKTIKYKIIKKYTKTCPSRVVFVEKISEEEVTFRIDLENYTKKVKEKMNIKCTYQFVSRSSAPGKEDTELSYTKPKPFENGTIAKLEEEIVVTNCKLVSAKHQSNIKDAYLILKKKTIHNKTVRRKIEKEKWNILIVGMDTMSRARAYSSMPIAVNYMQTRDWLDFRGYTKVGSNTFPNVMAILSGKNASSAYSACGHGMDSCGNSLIWNKFREAGYVTAYGEENIDLPDTFSPYKGFSKPPTDHYARPLFLLGEHRYGNTLCTGNKPSPEHLLEYSLQFAQAYRNDTFFGFFWTNSYSHNSENVPSLFENSLIHFFDSLNKSNILDKTFIFFVSDHGIRFGDIRIQRESFYEERLPMFFMWVPYLFRELYPDEYYNLKINQHRLTSPYDLHATLWDLMKKTKDDVDVILPEACPRCTSLIEEIQENRTCTEASINEKWCTCHNLTKADNDPAAERSVEIVADYIQNKSISIKTKKCTICSTLKLKKVLRKDRYINGSKTYYIVAIRFSPGDVSFEATVELYDNKYQILPPTDTISPYHNHGYCAIARSVRGYCVCKKIAKCH